MKLILENWRSYLNEARRPKGMEQTMRQDLSYGKLSPTAQKQLQAAADWRPTPIERAGVHQAIQDLYSRKPGAAKKAAERLYQLATGVSKIAAADLDVGSNPDQVRAQAQEYLKKNSKKMWSDTGQEIAKWVDLPDKSRKVEYVLDQRPLIHPEVQTKFNKWWSNIKPRPYYGMQGSQVPDPNLPQKTPGAMRKFMEKVGKKIPVLGALPAFALFVVDAEEAWAQGKGWKGVNEAGLTHLPDAVPVVGETKMIVDFNMWLAKLAEEEARTPEEVPPGHGQPEPGSFEAATESGAGLQVRMPRL